MSTITVNSTVLPEPSKMTPSVYMVGDSKRSANGIMNVQFIANKRKYSVVWGTITAAQHISILSVLKAAINPPTFSLTILDPSASGGSYTGTFYAGDLTWDTIKIDSYGNATVKDVKCDLIEV